MWILLIFFSKMFRFEKGQSFYAPDEMSSWGHFDVMLKSTLAHNNQKWAVNLCCRRCRHCSSRHRHLSNGSIKSSRWWCCLAFLWLSWPIVEPISLEKSVLFFYMDTIESKSRHVRSVRGRLFVWSNTDVGACFFCQDSIECRDTELWIDDEDERWV